MATRPAVNVRRPPAVTFESADAVRVESDAYDIQIYARSLQHLEALVALGEAGPLGAQHREVAALLSGYRRDDEGALLNRTGHVFVMYDHCDGGRPGFWTAENDLPRDTSWSTEYPRRLGEFSPVREGGQS